MSSNAPTLEFASPARLAPASEAARGAAGPQTAPALKPPSGETAPSATILVIEDDPRSARLVSANLQTAGYRVSTAGTAGEAQQIVERNAPDLVLCDVCLPDMDGIQFTRWLRARHPVGSVPIALITSSDDSKILARGLEAGADDFLAKPVNALELRTRVRSLLRSKLLADELYAREQAALPFGNSEAQKESQQPESVDEELASVIIIEDNPQERRLLESHLRDSRCKVRTADGASSGMALVREVIPDLIVLDLLLPDRDGYEFIATIKNDPQCSQVPILVVSAMSEVKDRVKALELGADDFIVKGFERVVFEARVRRLLRVKLSLDKLSDRCNQALQMAVTDSLTGLFTQGFMRETLRRQLACAERFGKPFSIIFGDIDHFKSINDRYGHAVGDAVLKGVASSLRAVVRQSDTLARYGGEEFVLLMPHSHRDDAMNLAERMRSAVANMQLSIPAAPELAPTMSLGVATYPSDARDANALIECGDAAMYRAKQSGRDRVVAYSAN